MKLDKRYYCFGCHATGDAIDFVSAYLQLSPLEAAKRLAADFNIPYDWHERGGKYDHAASSAARRKAQSERQAFRNWRRKTLFELAGYYRILEERKALYAPCLLYTSERRRAAGRHAGEPARGFPNGEGGSRPWPGGKALRLSLIHI